MLLSPEKQRNKKPEEGVCKGFVQPQQGGEMESRLFFPRNNKVHSIGKGGGEC